MFQEGYSRGFSEAASQLGAGVERAAGAAFARSLQGEEELRAGRVADAAAALRKEQYRCVCARGDSSAPPSRRPLFRPRLTTRPPPTRRAPKKAVECAAEEAAVLACQDAAASEPLIQAYVACARNVVQSRMRPGLR